jgi:type IV secretory pathway TrbF-like protein
MSPITPEWLTAVARVGAEAENVPVQASSRGRAAEHVNLVRRAAADPTLACTLQAYGALREYIALATQDYARSMGYAAGGNTLVSVGQEAPAIPFVAGGNSLVD